MSLRESLCERVLVEGHGNVPIQLNDPSRLAPIDLKLWLLVDGKMVKAKRTKLIDKNGMMEFEDEDGNVFNGRYYWGYV